MSNITWTHKLRTRLTAFLMACAMVCGGVVAITAKGAAAARADATHQVEIGMPFAGQWAYNANVNPPYTDANSSHPSVHHTPGGGDWATDVYAAEGTAVKLEVGNTTGTVTYSWGSSSTSCGQSTLINVFVAGVNVGWLYFAHLNNAVTSGAITTGMTLGTVKTWYASDGSVCNPGTHVHIEFKNTTNYACYVDNGHPGVSVTEGAGLGVLGSTNTGVQQACSSVPGDSSSPTPDGSFIRASDTGGIYEMVGGSPMYVSNWGAVGGTHPITATFTWAQIAAMPRFPRDGTWVRDYITNNMYIVAGGAPLYINTVGSVPPPPAPVLNIDDWDLGNQLLKYPMDGTWVRDYLTGNIYIMVAGAPLYVSNPNNVPPPLVPAVNIDDWDLGNQLLRYPPDGTWIRDTTGGIYIIVGGAAMYVSSFASVPSKPAYIVNVDIWVIGNQLRHYPLDGTWVRGCVSGGIYEIVNQQAVHIATPSQVTGVPTNIDDWAIQHQLGVTG